MPTLDPTEAFEHLKNSTTGEISKIFPLVGKKNKITLNKIWVDDNQHIDDLRSQADTKMKGGTWAVPIKADLTLANHDGTVVDRKTLTLAHMPKYTRRYSFIVGGNEYQVDHQFRLKSGIYPRIQANGEISAQFNAMRGASTPEGPDNWDRTLFNVGFHPEKRKMTLTYRDTNVPLYSVVKALGGTDENMKRAWGTEVFHSNVSLEPTKDLRKLYKVITRKSGEGVPEEELTSAARTAFHDMAVDPNVVEKTVGHRTDRIDHNSLTMAGNRLIGISKGTHPPADRDSLEFKDLLSVGDLMAERVRHSAKEIRRKAANNIDRQTNLGQIIVPQTFRKPIGGYFTSNGTMASTVEQLNPLEMLSGHLKTTVMGKGGISSEHQIEDQMRAINPSSLGFLDPLHTPEGSRTGITLHLPIGVEKEGNTLKQRALDVATGQPTFITPRDLMRNVVSFADQYHTKDGKFLMKGGKPIPRSETVKASDSGEFGQTHHSKVKYILPQSKALFDPASNLLPFLPTAQGARATMAAKQMEQAVALKHREEPLVQTVAGQSGDNKVSFEKLLGQFASHVAPVGGKVVRVQPGAVHIQDAGGKLHEVQTYDHYPLNDNQAFLHSTPAVKAGDMVQKGQLVADTNFSKNGHLTLGTNIRTAYIPYKGLNFEDGVVISESAAKKLTSEHLHRVEFQRDDSHTLDRDKFRAYHPDVISGEHAKNLGEDGVIKVGTRVNPGDVLIAALKEHNLTSEDKILRSLNKTLASPYRDASERWHKDYPGVVTRVVQDGKNVKIHIKTEEPAQIGDKIVGRHANKGIITTILPDHEMPHTSDGQPLHVLMNPAGVPSRINPGQLLETAASKIAQKTGKPYFVDNFKAADHDYSKEVKDDLAHHGISDTEDVYDPKTKQLLGKGFVGSQYILKLKHQVTKKTSVRSGGVEMPYDSDFAPRKGPPNSAQAMDPLSLYAMLSHGARHNLREIATWKAGGADRKYNQEFWAALQAGASLPTPKPTFAYDKFHNMIRGLGVNVEKQGNSLHLVPFTDTQVRNMSSWEVKDPSKMVIAKNMKPESDGLFSEHLGGPEGTKWGHITLNERMPNPVFEGPIQDLLGIKTKDDYERIINGEVPIEGKRGGAAIAHALSKLDTGKELEDAKVRLSKATKSNRDKLNRKVKYLQALKESGLTAHDAYTQQVIPVLPPIMRPYSRRPSGELLYADVNELYKHIGQDNQQMKKFDPRLPDEEKNELRAHLYDNLRSLAGLGGALNTRERRGYRGIIQQISGKKAGEGDGSPKEGYFQRKIMKRQQDLSMRSTIVPEPSLGLDQVVLPRHLAMELYKPFVVRQLRGMGLSTPAALREVKDKGEMAHRALEHVVDERPILMKRDPVLHKYGVQAFKPVLGEGKAIKIHPLVTSGYNADFDGDCIVGEVIVVALENDPGCRTPEGNQEVAMPHTGKIAVHKVLDIKNFPRIEESKAIKRSGVIEYDVPVDTYVPAYNGGKMGILPVTKYSIHPNCEEWRVLSRANREIFCSSDHSLAILDPETLEVVKTPPRNAVGKCFPVMQSLEDPNLWGAIPGSVSGCGSHKMPDLAEALGALRSSEVVDPGRNDFVPLPEWVRVELLGALRDLGAALRPPRRNNRAFSQYVVLNRKSPVLTRESVEILWDLCAPRVSQWLERWFMLALDTTIGWDLVESAEPTGEIKEMYDITVPDAWTFTMANGAVVWDTMSGYVPISQEAVQEARKMMPSENLFSPANGKVMYTPKQDMVLGLHRLSEWGKDSGKSFQTGKDALQAFKSKKIGETDVVDIGGMKTTVGRLIMAHSLSKVQGLGPEHHGERLKIAAPNITTKILSDPNWRADKNTIAEILTHVGKADPGSYSHVSNRLKDLGDDNVYRHLFSYNLGDLQTAKHLRDPLIQEGRSKEKAILSSGAPKAEKHQKVVELWSGINSRMNPIFQKHADDTGNTFRAMERSGARGNWNQIKQILAAPLVVTNSEGKPLPYAITKNFAEGLDTSDYWVSLHGARRGAVMRSKETEDPGFLSKQMMQSTIGNTVTAHDCGTTEGISMSADNPEIHDRYLAKPLKVGEHTHQAGTLITPNLTQEMRKHSVDKAVVRTPLHCEHTKGICARCYGLDQDGKLPALGTNLGAIATQSLGEPLTQGAMQVFHIGAVATTGPKVTDDFTRLNQLVSLPATLKDQAALSTAHGKVEKVEKDPAVGGWHVTVGGRSHYVPQHLGLAVKRGDEVKKGSQLSHGLTNPHELLELNGINAVKQHITDEIGRLYKGKASRKNVEVVVRSLTDLSEVDHPGDSDHFLRGDRASTSAIMAENRRLQKEGRELIKHTPFLAGIGQIPLKGSDDWVARLNHSRLKDTVLEAAAKGWHSPIHGHNPLGPYALGSEFGLSRPGHEGEY